MLEGQVGHSEFEVRTCRMSNVRSAHLALLLLAGGSATALAARLRPLGPPGQPSRNRARADWRAHRVALDGSNLKFDGQLVAFAGALAAVAPAALLPSRPFCSPVGRPVGFLPESCAIIIITSPQTSSSSSSSSSFSYPRRPFLAFAVGSQTFASIRRAKLFPLAPDRYKLSAPSAAHTSQPASPNRSLCAGHS